MTVKFIYTIQTSNSPSINLVVLQVKAMSFQRLCPVHTVVSFVTENLCSEKFLVLYYRNTPCYLHMSAYFMTPTQTAIILNTCATEMRVALEGTIC